MLVIFGNSSKIAEEVRAVLNRHTRIGEQFQTGTMAEPTLDADHYLFCAGVLIGKPVPEMSNAERTSMLDVNFGSVVSACEAILAANPVARICIVGSESGYRGSFDRIYAGSKAALHHYVETRRVGVDQQLVGIAPGIIGDAGMTTRRDDHENLLMRRAEHPKKRFLIASEVAKVIVFALYDAPVYLCNTVIRMNGGEHTNGS